MSFRKTCASVPSLFLISALVASGCSGEGEGPVDSGLGGLPAGTTVADGTGGSSLLPGTGVGGASTLGLGGAATGTTTGSGGTTSAGGAATGTTTGSGGTTSAGGTAAKGGATSAGGATAKGGATSAGGTTAKGGTTSAGGTTAKGGTTSAGGTTAKGGTTSAGGTTAKGGTTSAGGTTAKGGTTSAGGAGIAGCTSTGFHTTSGKLYDSKCKEFIMRGVNYPYAWFTGQNTNTRFSEIASTRANTVRVVMSALSGTITTAANVTSIIGWAKANKLIAILELHDCTGYGDDGKNTQPSQCLAYWLRSDVINVLKGQEAYVMINIANEAFGNATTAQWLPFYQGAIPQLRTAGLHHTIIVDAPNWGQDWEFVMRDGTGPTTIFNADPDRNTVFSVHMYDVFGTSTIVTNYFTKFLTKGLPFVVGEFAADHGSSGNVDEDTIMSLAAQRGIGYLGWSWSGNSAGLTTLDITNNFNLASLTTWGNRLINGTNGISASGTVCSVYQ